VIVAEQAYITPDGRYRERLIGADRDECINGLSRLADVIHSNNQIAVLQINHAGSAADISLTNAKAVAPSAVVHPLFKRSMPRELTAAEIHQIKNEFIRAALRVKKAGFDGVELHSCHGFLFSQFLSPLSNKRNDDYGGNLENRGRFLIETTKAVRRAVGEDYLLMARLGLADFLPCGLTLDEGCIIAEMLQGAGIDILDTSSNLKPATLFSGNAFFREMFKAVKGHVSIPVMGSGHLENIEIAADLVESGDIDFIALGRSILEQPNYVEDLVTKIRNQSK
jgi:2,4-dienoyl-CoA reductase-like NADH-dependent reductase (Old Yellow Enzyme family)